MYVYNRDTYHVLHERNHSLYTSIKQLKALPFLVTVLEEERTRSRGSAVARELCLYVSEGQGQLAAGLQRDLLQGLPVSLPRHVVRVADRITQVLLTHAATARLTTRRRAGPRSSVLAQGQSPPRTRRPHLPFSARMHHCGLVYSQFD